MIMYWRLFLQSMRSWMAAKRSPTSIPGLTRLARQLTASTDNKCYYKSCVVPKYILNVHKNEMTKLKWNIIYQAEVTTSHSKQTYIGLCDTSFKSRYWNHTCSFRNERYRNSTELSKYVWGLKDKKTDYQIRWRCIRHARSYSNVTKKCNLCLWEKYYIICRPNMATLNKRNELVSSCRHAKKFLLNNVII